MSKVLELRRTLEAANRIASFTRDGFRWSVFASPTLYRGVIVRSVCTKLLRLGWPGEPVLT